MFATRFCLSLDIIVQCNTSSGIAKGLHLQ